MKVSESAVVEAVLEQFPEALAIYLFGSQVDGTTHSNSDCDLAVLLPFDASSASDPWRWIEATQAIAGRIGCERLDLIDLRKSSTVFSMQIVQSGKRIHCSNVQAADDYEVLVMALYQELQEERREIVEEGIRTGRFLHD